MFNVTQAIRNLKNFAYMEENRVVSRNSLYLESSVGLYDQGSRNGAPLAFFVSTDQQIERNVFFVLQTFISG